MTRPAMTRRVSRAASPAPIPRSARDALVRGAVFVGTRHPVDAGVRGPVSAMMVFNVLRELDVLLGLAITEAAAAWGLPVPSAEAPNAARLRVLRSHYALEVGEQVALRNLDRQRRWMADHACDASAPPRRTKFHVRQLAPAAILYAGIGAKLGIGQATETAPVPPPVLVAVR